jgi:hypothetical protein
MVAIQTMGQSKHVSANATNNPRQQRRKKGLRKKKKEVPIPYVLERTDCMVLSSAEDDTPKLQFFLHTSSAKPISESLLEEFLGPMLDQLKARLSSEECFAHVACVVLQRLLRSMLQPPRKGNFMTSTSNNNVTKGSEEKKADDDDANATKYLDAVAFIADGSLLPRKSGRSSLPMASPPAVPFSSPQNSEQLTRIVSVDVGTFWRKFLNEDGSVQIGATTSQAEMMDTTTGESEDSYAANSTVTMRGMIIPQGVTLIVGGGYHGKSTILQALCMGVYDNLPFDGRERVVTHIDAVSIRAEDGRYVHNTNVSAFISNLPSGKSINGASIVSTKHDTTKFSTKDASGSTSQAANVIEALEAGASTLLVDEDVSAANFMARDGRMRAMIMDEPITPLLYRVNGLYLAPEHKVSTVVVVGGVGEWLDVADAVVLMKDYVAYDGLKKAQSVSYQFSYGHVQYAGRGVVHRLPWEVKEEPKGMLKDSEDDEKDTSNDGDVTMSDDNDGDSKTNKTLSPLRRRPEPNCIQNKFKDAAVHLLESGSPLLWFYPDINEEHGCNNNNAANDEDEDDGMVDMSKCSQLVGNASEQLYGCGLCILWLMQQSQLHPDDDLCDLLDRMEDLLNNSSSNGGGMNELVASLKRGQQQQRANDNNDVLSTFLASHDALDLLESVGFAYRPRRHEVAMALTRMRGMQFDILPEKPKVVDSKESAEEEAKRLEEESKKRALAELWANRRKR